MCGAAWPSMMKKMICGPKEVSCGVRERGVSRTNDDGNRRVALEHVDVPVAEQGNDQRQEGDNHNSSGDGELVR